MRAARGRVPLMVTGAGIMLSAFLVPAIVLRNSWTSAAQKSQAPLAKPPEGQTFIGSKQCSACHFDQFMSWRTTKHAKGFEILPAKYKTDASCLKCHSTGYGEKTGYQGAKTPDLVGTSCEACHGPGSEHAKIAKGFGTKKLSKEEQDYVRSTTFKILPGNACATCHLAQGHKKHPPYDKKK